MGLISCDEGVNLGQHRWKVLRVILHHRTGWSCKAMRGRAANLAHFTSWLLIETAYDDLCAVFKLLLAKSDKLLADRQYLKYQVKRRFTLYIVKRRASRLGEYLCVWREVITKELDDWETAKGLRANEQSVSVDLQKVEGHWNGCSFTCRLDNTGLVVSSTGLFIGGMTLFLQKLDYTSRKG